MTTLYGKFSSTNQSMGSFWVVIVYIVHIWLSASTGQFKQRERKRDGERERFPVYWTTPHMVLAARFRTGRNQGAENSILIPKTGIGGPHTWAILCSPPRSTSSQNLNWHANTGHPAVVQSLAIWLWTQWGNFHAHFQICLFLNSSVVWVSGLMPGHSWYWEVQSMWMLGNKVRASWALFL